MANIKNLYQDPNYPNFGYYYLDNIKKDAIKIIEREIITT